jgi:hypothetical protein
VKKLFFIILICSYNLAFSAVSEYWFTAKLVGKNKKSIVVKIENKNVELPISRLQNFEAIAGESVKVLFLPDDLK